MSSLGKNPALPRRSIRGSIDIFKSPISNAHSPTGPFNNAQPHPLSPGPNLSIRSASPAFLSQSKPPLQNDFSALLNPGLYHTLTVLDIPPPFRKFATQPDLSISLSELISRGKFRDGAIKAAQLLLDSEKTLSSDQIFDLFYKRLACLTLCNQTVFAVQEVKALGDLNSAHYRDAKSGKHLVPWELRILAVRLQGIGFSDVRRGVIGFYDLVTEARLALTNLKSERKLLGASSEEDIKDKDSEIELWERRLSELSLRVASALIEMEDFEGASRFLSTLQLSPFNPNLNYQKALLWLFLGDVDAARNCAVDNKVVSTLAHIADAEFDEAVKGCEDLIETGDPSESALWKQNLAVSLIYLGRIDEARKIMEKLTEEEGYGFHALTFNLSTIYELCTERSRSHKIELAEKLSDRLEISKDQDHQEIKAGWDKVNLDFKL
ncbi:putative tetratricopeptide repeat protein 15 [Erysiphe neolycopersici]|uniref:Putative tetratricopeptide repeat protein 15 n=1 Tax=Erysiphe neolycopersici TaxID=212602 RepID=A0A420HBF8_9PEZI|nr:putative tetratricopeptide repeat protein 15 [Erysiphe neolycopersici]